MLANESCCTCSITESDCDATQKCGLANAVVAKNNRPLLNRVSRFKVDFDILKTADIFEVYFRNVQRLPLF